MDEARVQQIVEAKMRALDREYQECLAAEIKLTDCNEFKGLSTVLAGDGDEDDGFGEF